MNLIKLLKILYVDLHIYIRTCHLSLVQTESPSGKDLSLLGAYLLVSLVFVFSAMVEFAFVLFLNQKRAWLKSMKSDSSNGADSNNISSCENNEVSNGLDNISTETIKMRSLQEIKDQETSNTNWWGQKCTVLHGLPLTNKIDLAAFVLFYFFYLSFNIVYWVLALTK